MAGTQLSIQLVPGDMAPKYSDRSELKFSYATITEQGTEARLPIVDFLLEDPRTGEKFFAVLTGRIVLTLAGALRGVNMRNHGKPEP